MFLTKKHLSRRTTLKGLGISMGLPLLDAMIPAATALAATAAVPKPRVGFFYIPHGMIMDNTPYGKEVDAWTPSGSGANFTLNKIMKPMEKYKHQLTSIANLENMASAGSVHTLNPATWLSAVRPDGSQPGAHMSTTLDQVIAAKVGQETALPSLELAAETTIQSAACGGGAGACYYSTTLSFRNDHTPLPMEFNPRKVFLQLFGEGDTDVERQLISRQTTSILDLITDRTQALKTQLGAQDQRVMDNYLETVREIERRLEKAKARDLSKIQLPEAPVGELDNFDQQVGMMFDLVALAYQANLTRVASYIMVAEGTNRTYNFINVPDSFHPLSHHANDRERSAQADAGADLAHGAVREVRRQDGQHTRRRWLAARPLAVHVRLEHEQQRPAQQLSAAADPRGWRQWPAQGRQARGAGREDADRQPASDGTQQAGHSAGKIRRQHGHGRRSVM